MSIAIQLQSVTKKFKDFTAVDQLSFIVNTGEIYGFLGPNGSGKSTSLRMMMGLIKPSDGNIFLFENALATHRSSIMRRVGCIIEKPDFYNYLSAKENIKLFVRANQLNYTAKDYDALFDLVGLRGREADKVKTYSHGMKQRLGLAQTLLHNPDLIILDEPNTGLDPQGIIDLRYLLLKLNQEQGKTILFSSHILSEVQEICNSMIVINKGKAVAQGKVADLLSLEKLHVVMEVNDEEKMKRILSESKYASFFEKNVGNEFWMNMSKSQIAPLVQLLIENNLEVCRVDYKNQLEAYFLKITQS
jgi:ABC-2 type transport system ATP-binding protein